MAKVRGIGSIINAMPGKGAMLNWRSLDEKETDEMTVWSIFPDSTTI